jgi:MFS family permease
VRVADALTRRVIDAPRRGWHRGRHENERTRPQPESGGAAGDHRLVAQLLFWCGQAAFFVYFALYLQPGRGLSALQAGLVFTILAIAYVVSSGPTPALTQRFGRRVPLAGALTLAAGHALMALGVSDIGVGGSLAVLVPGMVLIGAGMGFCFTSLNAIALDTFDERRAGSASGVLATIQEIGNALGVAIAGVFFFELTDEGLDVAFEASATQFACGGLLIAALTFLLPARARRAPVAEPAPAHG